MLATLQPAPWNLTPRLCFRGRNKRLAISVACVSARLWAERAGKKLVPPMGEKNRTLILKHMMLMMKGWSRCGSAGPFSMCIGFCRKFWPHIRRLTLHS